MAIPEFYYFIRPALEYHQDGQTHHWRDVERAAIKRFALTENDLAEMIPSGRKTRLADRVQWALTYLRQAGLLESPQRGANRITQRGREYLRRAPDPIKPEDLAEFPEFAEFIRPRAAPSTTTRDLVVNTVTPAVETTATPEETMAAAYDKLNAALAQDVLERVKQMQPARFEQLIIDLMLKLGYGGADLPHKRLGGPGDEGVDGVINQDKLGLDKIYLQAKKWSDTPVGRKELQAFVGALSGQGATKGVFITASKFTQDAKDYVNKMLNLKISLINGLTLARLMIEHNLGVALVRHYDLKRVDSDFFTED